MAEDHQKELQKDEEKRQNKNSTKQFKRGEKNGREWVNIGSTKGCTAQCTIVRQEESQRKKPVDDGGTEITR